MSAFHQAPRAAFLLSRQCARAGLPSASASLYGLARQASTPLEAWLPTCCFTGSWAASWAGSAQRASVRGCELDPGPESPMISFSRGAHQKTPGHEPRGSEGNDREGSAQTDLGKDALAGEHFGGKADHEAEHGQAAIPGFSEGNETEAGGGVSHGDG